MMQKVREKNAFLHPQPCQVKEVSRSCLNGHFLLHFSLNVTFGSVSVAPTAAPKIRP